MSFNIILQYFGNSFSLVTIGMCCVLKFPQIFKLLESRSATGISLKSLILELISYTIMTCYNFTNGYSLLLYLEYPIILIQEYILIFLVLSYKNYKYSQILLAVLVYSIFFIGFLTELIPKLVLLFLTPMCIPISASSKVIQLMTIIRTKEVDSVSSTTWAISVLSNLTRMFTILMDSADVVLLGNFVMSTALSASIMFAVLYYKMESCKKE